MDFTTEEINELFNDISTIQINIIISNINRLQYGINKLCFYKILNKFINQYIEYQNAENFKHDFEILLNAFIYTVMKKCRKNESPHNNLKLCYKSIMKNFNSDMYLNKIYNNVYVFKFNHLISLW